jgi:hypothetical protein
MCSFFARVRARTSRSRRFVSRRNVRVRSSGVHTSSSGPDSKSRTSVRASSRSVFAFASVIDFSFRPLHAPLPTPDQRKAEALIKTLLRESAYRFAYPTSHHRRALPGYLR